MGRKSRVIFGMLLGVSALDLRADRLRHLAAAAVLGMFAVPLDVGAPNRWIRAQCVDRRRQDVPMAKEADEAVNRALWRQVNAEHSDAQANLKWAQPGITWGVFDVPETRLGVLGDVAGLDVVELGCGTAFFSAWLARLEARPVGVDLSPEQLATARRCQEAYGLQFPLVEASAERVPLPPASFDLAVSEYGASLWCEPAAWIGEAARLLRPGGRLVFLTSSVLVSLCVPDDGGHATDRLTRPLADQYRVSWTGGGVEYHPPHSAWIRVLRSAGFTVEALHELYAPDSATTPDYYEIAEPWWAQRWPVEDLWVARLGGQ